MSTTFRVIQADWQRDRAALQLVRETVFMHEQRVPAELEWDGLDPDCTHVLALDTGDRPIGTGRLTGTGDIGRMAVLPAWRRRGVGAAMLRVLLDHARRARMPELTLHAQVEAIDFYRHFGFACRGTPFLEADIPHQRMYLALSAPLSGRTPDTGKTASGK